MTVFRFPESRWAIVEAGSPSAAATHSWILRGSTGATFTESLMTQANTTRPGMSNYLLDTALAVNFRCSGTGCARNILRMGILILFWRDQNVA
jgi:hypothetical protein